MSKLENAISSLPNSHYQVVKKKAIQQSKKCVKTVGTMKLELMSLGSAEI